MSTTQGTDLMLSIKDEHMTNIASGVKTHEFRSYRFETRRLWLYVNAPISSLKYIAQIGPPREVGQVPDDGGLGNADFNAGLKKSTYGYEILTLWEFVTPLTLAELNQRGLIKGAPQGRRWVPQELIGACKSMALVRVLSKDDGLVQEVACSGEDVLSA